jgi:hypothetical protein
MTKITVLSLLAGAALGQAALAAEPVSRDEVRAMVAEMLADAETRSSLLQGGGVAGYDRGFVVRSPDGDWSLRLNGLVQFRYVANLRDNDSAPVGNVNLPGGSAFPTTTNSDDLTHSFQLRRSYLALSGNIVNKDLRYMVRLNQQRDNDIQVDDVFAEYNYGGGLMIRAGQFRPNFLKEQLNGEAFTLGVERGVTDATFNQGRAQGVSIKYSPDDAWNFFFDLTDGFRSTGTDLNARPAEYALTGRAEWVFEGSKEDLRDYTSKPGSGWSGQLGAAVHYQEAQEGAGTLIIGGVPQGPVFPQDKFFAWTADAQFEGGGWGFYGAVVNTHRDGDNATGNNVSAWGATLQASYRWDAAPEVFAKWDWINVESDTLPAPRDNYHFVTVGFNNYYADNAAKFTIDALWAITPTDPGLANLAGLVPGGTNPINSDLGLNGSNESGEVALRAQLQLLF